MGFDLCTSGTATVDAMPGTTSMKSASVVTSPMTSACWVVDDAADDTLLSARA